MVKTIVKDVMFLGQAADPSTKEGCLSLIGVRKTKRYKEIEVTYQDEDFVERTQKFIGFIAQVVQHEVDHLEGIII